jgi:hypothetical protein
MKVVNVVRQGEDVVVVGNREAIKALLGACANALAHVRGGKCGEQVYNTMGVPYQLSVERIDSVADLIKVPTS